MAAVVIAVAAVLAVIGPWIAPHDPDAINLSAAFASPSGQHPLGLDSQGRDVLSRLLAAAPNAIIGPLIVVVLSTVIGTAFALASAWRGGLVASGISICRRHLLPNVVPLIVAQAPIVFGYAMVDLAAISFIGLGVRPPATDWGLMVAGGQSGVLQGHPAEALAAGLCIVVVVVAFNLLGERLADRSPESR